MVIVSSGSSFSHHLEDKTLLRIFRQQSPLQQGCVRHGCWTQAYKDVFTASLEARGLLPCQGGGQKGAETMIMP